MQTPCRITLAALKDVVLVVSVSSSSSPSSSSSSSLSSSSSSSPPPSSTLPSLFQCREDCTYIVGGRCHKYHFCRDKRTFVATKMILVAPPASDSTCGGGTATRQREAWAFSILLLLLLFIITTTATTILHIALVVSVSGRLYMWGRNSHTIEGGVSSLHKVREPLCMNPEPSQPVRHVVCGAWHAAALPGLPGRWIWARGRSSRVAR